MYLFWFSLGITKHWELLGEDLRQERWLSGTLGGSDFQSPEAYMEGLFPNFKHNQFSVARTQLLLLPTDL